ncbi:MAG: hypothetical protein IKP76_01730 [Bacilli bacterium]|nr:hypothetical protein [Bacilli bacterium]
MATNYYLTDGNIYVRKAVYVPYKDTYIKNAADIAYLDEATIEMGKDIKDKLIECNPGFDFTDNRNYKIVRNPKQPKNLSIYEPLLYLSNDLSFKKIRLVEQFRDLSNDRIHSYEKTGKLSNVSEIKVERFMGELLDQVHYLKSNEKHELFSKQSIVGKEIKKQYGVNKYNMERMLKNYTQLRAMLIMLLSFSYKERRTPCNSSLESINDFYENIRGLEPESSETIIRKLREYKIALEKVQTEEELQKIQNSFNYEYQQMSLFELFPEEAQKIGIDIKKK